jgi:hypothetical protein
MSFGVCVCGVLLHQEVKRWIFCHHQRQIDGEFESRLANSFCLHNKLLGQLLQNFIISDQSDNKGDSAQSSTMVDRGTLSLLPSLLLSAKYVSATRVSVVLSTLEEPRLVCWTHLRKEAPNSENFRKEDMTLLARL